MDAPALGCWNDHLETAELLISKGAQVNIKSKSGDTPAYIALSKNYTESYRLLKKYGGKE